MSNLIKKSIILTVSSLAISQSMIYGKNIFDDFDFENSKGLHYLHNLKPYPKVEDITYFEKTSSSIFGDFFNNPMVTAQPAKTNSTSFDEFFRSFNNRAAAVQPAKANSTFFDEFFRSFNNRAAAVQPAKTNSTSFDEFSNNHTVIAQPAKTNSTIENEFDKIFEASNKQTVTIEHLENYIQQLLSELKTLNTQQPSQNSELPLTVEEFKKITAKIAILEEQINNLISQLRSGNNQPNTSVISEIEKQIESIKINEIKEKIEDFKTTYADGPIPLSSREGGQSPIHKLMEEIKAANDKKAAEDLVIYLETELNSSDSARVDSVSAILNSSLPTIIKDAQASIAKKDTESKIKLINEEGQTLEANETANVINAISTTPITQINPGSLLLLFTPEKLSSITNDLYSNIFFYFKNLTKNQRKVILAKLSTVVGDYTKAIATPENAKQKIFALMYENLNRTELFSAPRHLPERIKLDLANRELLRLSGNTAPIIADPIILPVGPNPAPAGPNPAPAGPNPAPAGPNPAPAGPNPAPAGPNPAPAGPNPAPAGPNPAPARPNSASQAFANMQPVIPTDGVGSGRTLTATPTMVDGLNINNDLRPLNYKSPQIRVIENYMKAYPGTTAKTAVHTLITHNHPLFLGTSIHPST
ncbi:MAG: hypothetical protein ACRYGR_00330 [Janthinobacterium lividum]